jgi:hypothetical protein
VIGVGVGRRRITDWGDGIRAMINWWRGYFRDVFGVLPDEAEEMAEEMVEVPEDVYDYVDQDDEDIMMML